MNYGLLGRAHVNGCTYVGDRAHAHNVGNETFTLVRMYDVRTVADQFKVSWRHTSKPSPTVRRVYKIVGTQASLDKYEAYR